MKASRLTKLMRLGLRLKPRYKSYSPQSSNWMQALIEMERAHRDGKFSGDARKSRPVMVKLLCFKDKELIMTKARANLKNTSEYKK